MRNYYKAVALVTIVLLLGITGLYLATANGSVFLQEDENSAVVLNEICSEAEAHWDDLSAMELSSRNIRYVILDNSNRRLRSSDHISDDQQLSVEMAIRERYPYCYVIRQGEIVGSVILLGENGGYSRMRLVLLMTAGGCALLFVIGMLAYGAYIRRRIVEPFQNLQEFAGRIAEGNLDIPLSMDKGNMFGVFTESFDIMREELVRAKERELALQKKEKELVASLSHDLKTPVTGIKTTGELLLAKCAAGKLDAADVSVKMENICKKADQIDALVSDLFSSTLDDLGEFRVNCTDESSQVLKDIVMKYDDRGLVARNEIPEVLVHMDVKSMSQVIGNIISNSYKYANTAIDTEYTVVEQYLKVKIRDHGPGVPNDEIDLITNKFYRGRDWKEGKTDGSGLGLYIAKMLMEKMNGDLLAESDGDGLSITLLIPLS